jgi:hypothetical protein
MAHHCAEAGLSTQAMGYWHKAGQQAVARSAMTEAVSQSHKGLDRLASLPDNSRRRELKLGLQVTLGPALIASRGFSATEVDETYAQASALAERLDRSDYHSSLLYGLWSYHLVRSEHRLALSLADRMEQIGDECNDAPLILGARALRGVTHFFSANSLLPASGSSSAAACRNRCIAKRTPPSWQRMPTPLGYLVAALAYLGYFDQARSGANERILEARRLQHAHAAS